MDKAIIGKYFPNLTGRQAEQFDALGTLYGEWNGKINLVSRKDIDFLYEHHILHSLGIAKFIRFRENTQVMDAGTGGGFPGIPLAVLFPDVKFHLVDSTGKKIKVVQAIAEELGLQNITTWHGRIEEERKMFDFVVSRAVMTIPEITRLVRKNISKIHQNALPNGLICLKGGNVQHETSSFGKNVIIAELKDYFNGDYFESKKIIHIPL